MKDTIMLIASTLFGVLFVFLVFVFSIFIASVFVKKKDKFNNEYDLQFLNIRKMKSSVSNETLNFSSKNRLR